MVLWKYDTDMGVSSCKAKDVLHEIQVTFQCGARQEYLTKVGTGRLTIHVPLPVHCLVIETPHFTERPKLPYIYSIRALSA